LVDGILDECQGRIKERYAPGIAMGVKCSGLVEDRALAPFELGTVSRFDGLRLERTSEIRSLLFGIAKSNALNDLEEQLNRLPHAPHTTHDTKRSEVEEIRALHVIECRVPLKSHEEKLLLGHAGRLDCRDGRWGDH
jgi:hypothetical protein